MGAAFVGMEVRPFNMDAQEVWKKFAGGLLFTQQLQRREGGVGVTNDVIA